MNRHLPRPQAGARARRSQRISGLFGTLAWWAFGATLLATAAFAPMGCTGSEVPAPVVTPPAAETVEQAAVTPDPVVSAIAVDEAVLAPVPAARAPRFTSLTTRADVTDLVIADGKLFASSTGGVDAWTLAGERIDAWGAEDGLPGNAIVDLHVDGDKLLVAGPGGRAALALRDLEAGFVASERAEGASLPHRLSAQPSGYPLTTAQLSTGHGRAVGTFSGAVHLEGELGAGVRTLPGVVLHLQQVTTSSGDRQLVAVSTQGVYAIDPFEGATLLEQGDLSAAAPSDAGGLLLGFRDGGIVERTPEGERVRRRRARGPAVSALLEHGGALFFAVEGEGVRKASARGVVRFQPRVDTCFNHIGALARWQGRIMLGGFDGGLCELGEQGAHRRWQTPRPLPSDIILSLATSGETLWVGTSYGVARLDPRPRRRPRVRAFTPSFNNRYALSGYGIVGIARTKAHLWIADGRGVSAINVADERDVVRHRALPELPEGLTDITAAGERVWVATEHDGISERVGDDWRLHSVVDGLAEAWVTKATAAADGRAWAGHSMKGVSFFDGERWQVIDERHGLPDGAVVSLHYDAALDVVWVGTLGGLAALSGDAGRVLGAWDSRHGLPDPRVHGLLVDGEKLWLATEGGLASIEDRSSLLDGRADPERG